MAITAEQSDSWEPDCGPEYFFNEGVEIVLPRIHEKGKRANDNNVDRVHNRNTVGNRAAVSNSCAPSIKQSSWNPANTHSFRAVANSSQAKPIIHYIFKGCGSTAERIVQESADKSH